MKKSTKKILYSIGLLILTAASMTAIFAAFVFNQEVPVETTTGDFEIIGKNYVNYAKTTSSTDERAKRLREDTVAIIERVRLTPTTTYVATQDDYYLGNKDYYTDAQGQNKLDPAEYEVGDPILIALFEAKVTYNGVDSATGYDSNLESITFATSGSSFSFTNSSEIITITITSFDSSTGLISNASILSTDASKDYSVVIGTNGTSMIVIDNALTKSIDSQTSRKISADRRITCSATSNKLEDENIYLSHLGLQFSFKTRVAAYVRIQIMDAWTRTRVYSSNVREVYVMKDQIGGKSPFTVNDPDWYYDSNTNIVYLKQMVTPEVDDETGEYETFNYTFNVNGGYFYNVNNASVYTEYVSVDVSFKVDIIQANRAKSAWGIDPSTDLNN